jgi:hypothetical protein
MGRYKAFKVKCSNSKIRESKISAVQHDHLYLLSLPGQVGQIARVDPDPDGAIAEIVESHRNGTKVQRSAPAISLRLYFIHF